MKKIIFSFIFLFLSLSSTLFSFEMPISLQACQKDYLKFCSAVRPGEGRVQNCLMDKMKKVSRSCKTAQKTINKDYEKRFAFVKSSCNREELNYCSHLRRFAFRVSNCLKQEFLRDKLNFSKKCTEGFTKHINFLPEVMP